MELQKYVYLHCIEPGTARVDEVNLLRNLPQSQSSIDCLTLYSEPIALPVDSTKFDIMQYYYIY